MGYETLNFDLKKQNGQYLTLIIWIDLGKVCVEFSQRSGYPSFSLLSLLLLYIVRGNYSAQNTETQYTVLKEKEQGRTERRRTPYNF